MSRNAKHEKSNNFAIEPKCAFIRNISGEITRSCGETREHLFHFQSTPTGGKSHTSRVEDKIFLCDKAIKRGKRSSF